jgi:3-phosphoshikimate 1-carboxyvinyltransferase
MNNPQGLATADPRLHASTLEIERLPTLDATVRLPGSKSYTNRALAIAALAEGPTTLHNALLAEDTVLLLEALQALGRVRIVPDSTRGAVLIEPTGQPMTAPTNELYMGNAGTGLRFLTTLVSLAEGRTRITGNARMQERPIGDLIDALRQLGVEAESVRGNGSPPVEVRGPTLRGGSATIRGSISSQFTSSLLISAPRAASDVEILIEDDLVSKPYIDMTIAAMQQFGVDVGRHDHAWFQVRNERRYQGRTFEVEPDASGMSYFLAAAAILNGRVHIPGIGEDSVQGDVGLLDVLARMGCKVELEPSAVTLEGAALGGVDVDMESMPDTAPTLAVVAAFATGDTRIHGIGNLRLKECDRIAAVATELRRMGIAVHEERDALTITGGTPSGAVIDTYDDHRIAMSFAIAGLRTPGVVIRQPGCVVKSFPTFWQALDGLRSQP